MLRLPPISRQRGVEAATLSPRRDKLSISADNSLSRSSFNCCIYPVSVTASRTICRGYTSHLCHSVIRQDGTVQAVRLRLLWDFLCVF